MEDFFDNNTKTIVHVNKIPGLKNYTSLIFFFFFNTSSYVYSKHENDDDDTSNNNGLVPN